METISANRVKEALEILGLNKEGIITVEIKGDKEIIVNGFAKEVKSKN